MHTNLRSKLLFIIMCPFATQAGELALVASNKKFSTGLLEQLPPELLSDICWQIFATKQPYVSFGQNVLSARWQRAQAILDIDIHSVNSFEQVSQQIKNAVSDFKINCKKKLPLLLTRRNNLFAHEYCAAFFNDDYFTELITRHTAYYAKLYTLVEKLPENEVLVIPQELLDVRDTLIPSYRCAAANRLCEYIHSKQDAATKRALLAACRLDSYGMIPVNIDYLLHPGKNLTFLSELVTKNPNIVFDSLDDGSTKLLHIAIQCNNLAAVEMLSAYSVNIGNKDGDTALISATLNYSVEMVKALLDKNANPNVQNNKGNTALICAVLNNNKETVNALLARGSNPDVQNNSGNTGLICAAHDNDLEKVNTLLAHKADPHISNNNGSTPLSFAQVNKNQEMIDILQAALQKS